MGTYRAPDVLELATLDEAGALALAIKMLDASEKETGLPAPITDALNRIRRRQALLAGTQSAQPSSPERRTSSDRLLAALRRYVVQVSSSAERNADARSQAMRLFEPLTELERAVNGVERRRFYNELTLHKREIAKIARHLCEVFGATKRRRPARVYEPDELIDEAVSRILSGRRAWKPDVPFTVYMRLVMFGILFERMARGENSTRTIAKGGDDLIAAAGTNEAAQEARTRSRDDLEQILVLFKDDEQALVYIPWSWITKLDRVQIAQKLHWPLWKVDRVRARVRARLRRAAARRLLKN